jgi:DNA modification methylase
MPMGAQSATQQASIPFVDSIVEGDCRELMRQLPDECLDAVITSPPYYQQRDYGIGDIGNEPSLDAYIQNLLSVFAVRFKHRPHPTPPRGRGGSRDSSPVHGGGWEGGMLKNQRKDTYKFSSSACGV